MKAGDRIEVEATDLSPAGDGVGAVEEVTVHVPGLLPGERGRVRIEHRSKQHPRAHAVLEERLAEDPARRPPPCRRHPEHGGRCGGCPLMALPPEVQRERKRAMLEGLGLSVPELAHTPGADLGYRWSSKRVAFDRRGRTVLGSWERGSHRGASMAGCAVDHPRLTEAAREIEAAAQRLEVRAYDEATGEGELRAVWLRTDGTRVLVTLVTASTDTNGPRARWPTRCRPTAWRGA